MTRYQVNSGVTVDVLVSSDLENWAPLVDQYLTPEDLGNNSQRVYYRDHLEVNQHPKRFFKLQVSE